MFEIAAGSGPGSISVSLGGEVTGPSGTLCLDASVAQAEMSDAAAATAMTRWAAVLKSFSHNSRLISALGNFRGFY